MWRLVNLVGILKSVTSSTKRLVRIRYTKNIYEFCRLLYSMGYINNFKLVNGSSSKHGVIQFSLRYYEMGCSMRSLMPVSGVSHKTSLSLDKFRHIQAHCIHNTTYILSSSKGIISHFDAIRLKSGGLTLCRIN